MVVYSHLNYSNSNLTSSAREDYGYPFPSQSSAVEPNYGLFDDFQADSWGMDSQANLRLTEGLGNDHCNLSVDWCLMREPSDLVTESTLYPSEESSVFNHVLDSGKHPFYYVILTDQMLTVRKQLLSAPGWTR